MHELGGKADTATIRATMERGFGARLGAGDRKQLLGRGEERWWWYTMWNRHRLKREGIFRANSKRGVWELSEQGRDYVLQHIARSRR